MLKSLVPQSTTQSAPGKIGRKHQNFVRTGHNNPGLLKQPVRLACFNDELPDGQAKFAEIKWMLVKEELDRPARWLQASKLQHEHFFFLIFISP